MYDDRPAAPPPTTSPPPRPQSGYALPTHTVWATFILLGLNALIFLLMEFQGGSTDTCNLLRFGAKFNLLLVSGEWWRLVTPIFLHIGVVHLFFNEYALLAFGRDLERLFGTAHFLAIYMLAGLFGNVASFAFSPAISAGASGSIFGIIGALAAFFLRNRERFGEMGRRQLSNLVTVLAINLLLGFTFPGIDNYGHIGGLVAGFLLGLALSPFYGLQLVSGGEALSMQVIDRTPFWHRAAALVVALGVLYAAIFVAIDLTPLDQLDRAIVARCLTN